MSYTLTTRRSHSISVTGHNNLRSHSMSFRLSTRIKNYSNVNAYAIRRKREREKREKETKNDKQKIAVKY